MFDHTSPLAPARFPDVYPVKGVQIGGIEVGIKYKNRPDLFLAKMDEGTNVAGVFTTSTTCSAAVHLCRKHLTQGKAQAIIVNAGNANAFCGEGEGISAADIVQKTAEVIGCPVEQVFHASTGVIGEPLKHALITEKIAPLSNNISDEKWEESATAIMTTDTYAKAASVKTEIDGEEVVISGIAKGSGMIAPNMATMLAFVFTDAKIPSDILQNILNDINQKTFNAITVDSDTSTSDTMILCATGKANHQDITDLNDARLDAFKTALFDVMKDLAHQIVRDGEGAEKFITINVKGAENDRAAHVIGMSIANSPLVKTALAASDANWGRVVMAVGKSGEKSDRDKLSISFGGLPITVDGQIIDGFDEAPIAAHLQTRDIIIDVDLKIGNGAATVWTCDLTHRYIDINGSYRS